MADNAVTIDMNKVLRRGAEFRRVAEQRRLRSYIVEGIIPPSSLLLVPGLPQSGKSTLFAALATSVTAQQPFLDRKTTARTPFIWLNADCAGEDFFLDQAQKSWFPGIQDAFDEYFFDVHPDTLNSTVTSSFLAQCISVAESHLGTHQPGVLVVDTMRNAFLRGAGAGAENDPGIMAGILRPIRELTRKSGWTILLSHHSAKGSGAYAGSTAILASCDGELTLKRSPVDINRIDFVVSIRGMAPHSFKLMDTPDGLKVLAQNTGTKATSICAKLVESLPRGKSNAVTDEHLLALNMSFRKTLLRNTLNEWAASGEHDVRRIGKGRRGDPFKFYVEAVVA
ncbi:hypothetical protein Pan44_28200 [Caulifigura coniformis]|uniref:Uncharacterized protein n=1 Tax=Caulifigura coniformis TaxID=2527983 RepID=A0A517SF81_9PLAN|nr:AAA family ATPase [Caulifigura coniformis]QDT54782.1 hypothetical protein Pan44_28200 [Caulifigura coniformis]